MAGEYSEHKVPQVVPENVLYQIYTPEQIAGLKQRMRKLAQENHVGHEIEDCTNAAHPDGLGVFKEKIYYYYNVPTLDRSTRAVSSPLLLEDN